MVYYAKAWFLAPLPASAARNDLQFQFNMLQYRHVEPKAVFNVLPSLRRHQWYLTPQLVTLALCDKGLDDRERELLAKTLFNTPRDHIANGRPDFPDVVIEIEAKSIPSLHRLVNKNSWLIFNLLGLDGKQEWLQTSCSMWHLFADFLKLREFSTNLSVTNDVAERGIRMISDFLNATNDETQRQALLQTVEHYREIVPNLNKKSLYNC